LYFSITLADRQSVMLHRLSKTLFAFRIKKGTTHISYFERQLPQLDKSE